MASEILMFHRIIPDEPTAFGLPGCTRIRGTAMTMEELQQILEGVERVLPLSAVERALRQGREPPEGTVLTFDDGYREHLDVARWLAGRGLTATFYIATGIHAEGARLAPVDAWYWLLDHANERIARVGSYEGRVDTLNGKTAWVTGAPKAAYLDANRAHQEAMLEELAGSLGLVLPDEAAGQLYLSRGGWTVLKALGMTVGAHSVTHPRLMTLDDEALRREVAESIEELSGPFAYPDGGYDERVVGVVREAGATSAVTCVSGLAGGGQCAYRMPRRFVRPALKVPADGGA